MRDVLLILGFGVVTAAVLALSAVAFSLEHSVGSVLNLARMTRIRAHRATTQAWPLDGATAAYADFVPAEAGTVGTFSPYSGFGFILITLATAVVGGRGKLFSTMAGGVIAGIVLTFTAGYINSSYEPAFSFEILALVVLFRPQGLFTTTRRSALE